MRWAVPAGDIVNAAGLPAAEMALCRRALELCSGFRRALDIHAHIGVRTALFEEQFNRVEAFEPHEGCYRCITQNVDSPRVTLRRVAVHAKVGPGFVAIETGKDSANATIHLQSLKKTTRIPLATVDSFGWKDVDLIFVSRSADWLEVITGAIETIRATRPVICVRPKQRYEKEASILKRMAQLLDLGYKIEDSDEEGLILYAGEPLSPPPNAKAVVSLLSDPVGDDQYLVATAPDPKMATTSRMRHSTIGRTLFPTRSSVLELHSGPAPFHELTIGQPFTLDGYKALTLPTGTRVRFDAVDRQEFASLAGQVGIAPSAAGAMVTMPAVLAAAASHLTVDLIDDDGGITPVFSKAVARISPIDAFSFVWPLLAMQATRRTISLKLFRGDAVIAEKRVPIDFTLHHIDSSTVNCYLNHGGGGNAAMQALADSLGCSTLYAENGYVPGISAVWGVLRGSKNVIDRAAELGTIFYYVDHAYFGRGHKNSYRITRDAFEAGAVRQCPPDRLHQHDVALRPWREGGSSIIVCPPTDYFKQAHDCHNWLEDTLATLARYTDRPVVIREKVAGETMEPLPSALADAHALVTHSSNVAIEAAVLGTPVFVSERSAARPVGLTDLSLIETPVRPPREQWLAHLAYSQFSFEEMRSGKAWALLQEFEQLPLVESLTY